MSEKSLRKFLSKIFLPETPDGIIRLTWITFACTAPILAIVAWRMSWLVWVVSLTCGMLGFNFASAYVNRLYWQSHQRMVQNQQQIQDALNQIMFAYRILHEHCPACGARFKAPEVRQ